MIEIEIGKEKRKNREFSAILNVLQLILIIMQ